MAANIEDRFRFRVFDNETKIMHNLSYKPPRTDENIQKELIMQIDVTGVACYTKIKFISNEIIMQCTSLKDKNDKLIYEGDIVLSENDHNKYVISWDNGCFTFRKVNRLYFVGVATNFEFRADTEGDDYTVIGNIYENPELI